MFNVIFLKACITSVSFVDSLRTSLSFLAFLPAATSVYDVVSSSMKLLVKKYIYISLILTNCCRLFLKFRNETIASRILSCWKYWLKHNYSFIVKNEVNSPKSNRCKRKVVETRKQIVSHRAKLKWIRMIQSNITHEATGDSVFYLRKFQRFE